MNRFARVDLRDIQSQVDEILYHFTLSVQKYVRDLDGHVEYLRNKMVVFRDTLDGQKGERESMQKRYDACLERMRKNDMTMDFMRGQVVRREALLHDQRSTFLKVNIICS
jgi:hypothetical protein